MANRSLFSPFASSVNPYAVRNIGRLFRRPDSIEINPEYLQLLQSGVEPSPEMLMSVPPFKGGTSAKAANAKFLSDMVQAQFGSGLATSREKELIPFRSQAEIEQAKTLSEFERKQKREIEEENLSNIGTARGQVLGSLPTEQLSGIIPQGTTFRSPVEQERFYQQQVGGNVPVSKAIVETDPNVIKGRIGEEAGKRFIDLGSGFKYDTITGEFVQAGRYENIQEQVSFDTGEPVPEIGPDGQPTGRLTTKKTLKLQSQPQYFPPRVGEIKATQEALDAISKESGAEVRGNLLSTDVGPRHVGPNLRSLTPPLNTTLQQPPSTTVQPNFWQRLSNIVPEEFRSQLPVKKKEKQSEKKEEKPTPKIESLGDLVEVHKLSKDQKEDFEFFYRQFRKNQGRYPTVEEAEAYIQNLKNKK